MPNTSPPSFETVAWMESLYQRTILNNPWIKHRPTEKQCHALHLDHVGEVLYGGSAGGGKSDWLLMEALKYVDVPGYAAMLFRRSYTDLSLPGALMDRAGDWLRGTAARWSDKAKTWHFPSGATLTFGCLENYRDHYRYQSAEFQFIGFDELTQFTEKQYRYLFSRLRRLAGVRVPVRMRAASNPGGIGHDWVRRHFPIIGPGEPGCMFVRASLDDNPHLDREEYVSSLGHLDPVERARLLAGDWLIQNEGLVFPDLANCVVEPRTVQGRAFAGQDWGWHNPAATIVGIIDHDDVLWLVEEVYGSHMTMDGPKLGNERHNRTDVIARARDLQDRHKIQLWYCDPSEPRSIETFRRADLAATEGYNKSILAGVQAVNTRIRTGKLRVFRTCKNLLIEAGLHRYPTPEERKIVGENPVDADNHILSATRYLVCGIDRVKDFPKQPTPVSKEKEGKQGDESLEKLLEMRPVERGELEKLPTEELQPRNDWFDRLRGNDGWNIW